MAAGPTYAAFISYSRAIDGRLAPRLQSALERFGKPWFRLRAIRVFRDDASLSANPGLWSSLTGALDRADFFILLASPGAAESEWVDREVEYWLGHRDRARLLIVLTEGEIAWDEHAADFDWERTTAVPRALAGAYAEEPRYTDLRFAATSEHLSLRDPRFRDAVADVAAPLNGRAKDDMIGEEVRQHRRTLRIARGAGVLLAALTAAASVAAVLAIRAADRADRERDRAEQEARVATSRQLAAQSAVAVADERLDGALSQAVEAWRTEPTREARDAVLAALKAAPYVVDIVPGRPAEEVTVSADGRRAALRDYEPSQVRVVELPSGRAIGTPIRLPIESGHALDPTGSRLAVGGIQGRVQLIEIENGGRRTLTGPVRLRPFERAARDAGGEAGLNMLPLSADSLGFARDGKVMAWSGPRAFVSVWDGRRVRRLRAPVRPGPGGWTVAVGDAGRVVVAAGAVSSELILWRAGPSGTRARRLPGRGLVFGTGAGQHGPIAIGGDRGRLLAVSGAGGVDLWDVRTAERVRAFKVGRSAVPTPAFSPDGRLLSLDDGGRVTLWRVATGERLASFSTVGAERGAAPLDDGRVIAFGADGAMTVRDLRAGAAQIARPLRGAGTEQPVAFDASGEYLASLDGRGRVRLWRVADGRRGPPLSGRVDAGKVAVLADGRVVTCCGDIWPGPARIWDDGEPRDVATELGDSYDMMVTTGGRLVVSGENGRRAAVWNGGPILELPRGSHSPDLSPDGRFVVVSTEDDSSIWDVERRRRVGPYPESAGSGVFSADGRLLATDAGGAIGLFDTRTGRQVAALGSDIESSAWAFSPDGRLLAAVVSEGESERTTLELWDVTGRRSVGDGALLDVADDSFSTTLAFSPDGRTLAVAGAGPEPLLVDVDVERWVARACELAPSCSATPSTGEPAARE